MPLASLEDEMDGSVCCEEDGDEAVKTEHNYNVGIPKHSSPISRLD